MIREEAAADHSHDCLSSYLIPELHVLMTHFLIPFFLLSKNGHHLEQIRVTVVINLKGDVNDNY
jgi:hypothetical protein